MLPQKNRLPSDEFSRRFTESFRADYFLLRSRPNNLNLNRFGIIISNKVDKRSVRRHCLKRRLSEYLYKLPNTSKDFLIVLSPRANLVEFKDLESALNKIFCLASGKLNPKP